MSKKAFQISTLTLFAALALWGAIALANSIQTVTSQPVISPPVSGLTFEAQRQLIHASIEQKDLDKADAAFSLMVTNFAQNTNLDEAVYETGKEYQYSLWNTEKANEVHNYNVQHFPDTKYGMLSNVEIIRSYIRSGKKTADAEVDLWLSKYSTQPDQAMGAYIIARAYAGNNKEEKAVELFQYAAAIAPKNIYGMLSQIRYDAAKKNYSAADVVADYLIASSHDSEDVKQGISDLANYYRDKKVFTNAIHFYQAEIDTWNEYDDQAEPYTKMIYSYIDMNDTAKAKSLIDKIQVELKENPKLARANFDIANYYLKTGDAANALLLHEFNVENYRDSLESLWSQAAQIWYYVRNGDEENAYIKYAEMLSIYADEKTLPKEVFQIGDIYIEVHNTEKARSLYQQVLDEWPESEYVFNAKAGFIKADIHDGYDEAAMTGIDNLMAEYMENTGLPHVVFSFGEQYLKKAQQSRFEEKTPYIPEVISEKTTLYYLKAREIWNKLITELPDSQYIGEATFMVAETYNSLNEFDQALETYKSFVDKWPDFDYSWVAQDRITKIYKRTGLSDTMTGFKDEDKLIAAYETLLEKFPDCPAAEGVQKKLDSYRIQKEIENIDLDTISPSKLNELLDKLESKGGEK